MSSPEDRPGSPGAREGNLEAPTRHAVDWKNPAFYDENALFDELYRVFEICHGCRRCFNLCQAFPTLFDLIDASSTFEIDGVDRKDYGSVVGHCYLCDMCYMTKCPYVPPHPWNVDFPHLMLRAKAVQFRAGQTHWRDRVITGTDTIGRLASLPVVVHFVNKSLTSPMVRAGLEKTVGIARDARLPPYAAHTARAAWERDDDTPAVATPGTRGRVAIFTTCYGNYNEPALVDDLATVLRHNDIAVRRVPSERCCGMPKLELGDLEAVAQAKESNIPVLDALVAEGWDLVAPVPSCVLMFKQELPLLFPDDPAVQRVKAAMFDPFEYLALRARAGQLKTDFAKPLGRVAYHVACHQRVQNVGARTREILSLVPGTEISTIERCSGHDGTYAVKKEYHAQAMAIARPVVGQVAASECAHYTSDCPIAGHHIAEGLADGSDSRHPLSLLRLAYGL